MEMRKITKKHIPFVVDLHKDSFKGFFLTELGDHFLAVYYDCVRTDSNGILIGLYTGNKLCGFFAAAIVSKGFNKKLIAKNFFRFSFIAIHLLFTRMSSLIRLLKNISKKSPEIIDNGEYAELLSVGVASDEQGKGIGKQLLMQFENEAQLHDVSTLSLTTDFLHNDKVIHFYKSLGYIIFYDFIAYPDRRMYRMIKQLN